MSSRAGVPPSGPWTVDVSYPAPSCLQSILTTFRLNSSGDTPTLNLNVSIRFDVVVVVDVLLARRIVLTCFVFQLASTDEHLRERTRQKQSNTWVSLQLVVVVEEPTAEDGNCGALVGERVWDKS